MQVPEPGRSQKQEQHAGAQADAKSDMERCRLVCKSDAVLASGKVNCPKESVCPDDLGRRTVDRRRPVRIPGVVNDEIPVRRWNRRADLERSRSILHDRRSDPGIGPAGGSGWSRRVRASVVRPDNTQSSATQDVYRVAAILRPVKLPRRISIFVLAWTLVLSTFALAGDGKPAAVSNASAARIATFETVWKIVNEKFYDPAFNGVDWQEVRTRYAPRVAAIATDAELYPLLNSMLGELKVSHLAVMPPQAVTDAALDTTGSQWGGDAGMTVRLVEGRPVVTSVAEGGPASAAGIRPGFVLTRIGRTTLGEVVARIEQSSRSETFKRLAVRRSIAAMLGGIPGSAVDVAFLGADDAPGTTTVIRADSPGKPARFGEMPSVLVTFESRTLPGNVGYIRFNFFMPVLMGEIRRELECFRDAPAIIIDLRDNPGGIGQMAPGIASLLVGESTSLGRMRLRRGEIRFVTYRQPWHFRGKVVLLTDEGSASTSEILAGSLQELGRATVVGERTLGAVLPSVIEKLPNGAVLQYAVADFKTPGGVLLEGRGVTPDIVKVGSRADYLSGSDPVLDAALESIAKQKP